MQQVENNDVPVPAKSLKSMAPKGESRGPGDRVPLGWISAFVCQLTTGSVWRTHSEEASGKQTLKFSLENAKCESWH